MLTQELDRDTLDSLQALMESPGWRVLVADLKLRYARLDHALHNTSDTITLADVRHLQGSLAEIKRLLERPDRLVAEIRAKFGNPSAMG